MVAASENNQRTANDDEMIILVEEDKIISVQVTWVEFFEPTLLISGELPPL